MAMAELEFDFKSMLSKFTNSTSMKNSKESNVRIGIQQLQNSFF